MATTSLFQTLSVTSKSMRIRPTANMVASTSGASRCLATSSRRMAAGQPFTPLDDLIEASGQKPSSSPGSVADKTKYQAAPRKQTATHSLHIKSSRNNVILTYTDDSKGGKVFRTITGGIDKDFKKAHRSSYEAAHQAALKVFKAIEEHGKANIRVAFNGIFGQGREAVAAALAGPEGIRIRPWVVKVEDRTPIKIGGTRAKKPRRL